MIHRRHGRVMLSTTRNIKQRATKPSGGIERAAKGKAMRNLCNAVCRKQAKRAVMSIIPGYISYVVGSRISGIAETFQMVA